MRKFGSALLIFTLASLAPVTMAHSAKADDPVAAATPTASPLYHGQNQPPKGDDQGRPRHHIDEDREGGIETVQIVLVGAAILVAVGLAYRAGRRRRDA